MCWPHMACMHVCLQIHHDVHFGLKLLVHEINVHVRRHVLYVHVLACMASTISRINASFIRLFGSLFNTSIIRRK